MNLKLILFLLVSSIFIFSFNDSFAEVEPILITVSPSMNDIIFDGKWTNYLEWKQSSHNQFSFGVNDILHLRTAHYGDYIYVLVDAVSDLTLDEKKDQATVCLDGENNKNKIHDNNDFCFTVMLGDEEGFIFQGNQTEESNLSMHVIPNPHDFIAKSAISDENDRYTKTPHPSYEFKIPIDLLERSDNYGFYLSVYDSSLDKFYSWPQNSTRKNLSEIPSPSSWGDIISPDKSLPELNLPILVFTILIFMIIILQSKGKIPTFTGKSSF